MDKRRQRRERTSCRRPQSGRRRRWLLLVFALIFGAVGGRDLSRAQAVSFAAQPPISTTANGADSVLAADVDADGDLDALSASYWDDTIAWYENAGGGGTAWILHIISTGADGPKSIFAADVDGDGDLDALSASQSDDKIAWYENVGGGGTAWILHTISLTADAAQSVFAADVDGDGDLDALSASSFDGKIAWYENVDGGGISWALHTISLTEAYSVFAADVDGDGDLDALSASHGLTIDWYENVGGGGTSWILHPISTAAYGARSIFAADVDGDGDLDALAAVQLDNMIAWYENLGGSGTAWTIHTITLAVDSPILVFAADVDGDGDLDALSASRYDDKIAWYENAGGDGTSWVHRILSTSADFAFSVFAADVDGDGDLDVLSASIEDDEIAWYRNDAIRGSATFASPPAISNSADGAERVFTADVDGDGDLDVLSASYFDDKIAWYENLEGDGTSWILHIISTAADGANAVFAADVDGDGDSDVLSASIYDDKIAWYENAAGNGTSWVVRIISTSADFAFTVSAADVDGDGDLDALSASIYDDKVAWYENVFGRGTSWALHSITTGADAAVSVFAADLDGDGDLDALTGSFLDDTIAWYENFGGAGTSWSFHAISDSADGNFSVFAADVDGDGDLDALSASRFDDKIAWYENFSGDGESWTLHTISTAIDGGHSVIAGDADGDGDLDAFSASEYDDKIAWHENVGGSGSSWIFHTISLSADLVDSVFAADVDGDGDLDALSASHNDGKVAWYRNDTTLLFSDGFATGDVSLWAPLLP